MLASIDSPQGDQALRAAARHASTHPTTTMVAFTRSRSLALLRDLGCGSVEARITGSDTMGEELAVDQLLVRGFEGVGRLPEQVPHLRPRGAGTFPADAALGPVDEHEVRRARHLIGLPRGARHHDGE